MSLIRELSSVQEYYLPFVARDVPPCRRGFRAYASIRAATNSPQLGFTQYGARYRLIIPRSVAKHFDILDIRIGGRTQMAVRRIPASVFDPATGGSSGIFMEDVEPGQEIALVVMNRSTWWKPRTFTAALIGMCQEKPLAGTGT